MTPTTVAPKPQGPSIQPTTSDSTVIAKAIHNPQRPGIRPEGIGRSGSLIASTCRSHQSFAAWLIPQTTGPARITPRSTSQGRSESGAPEETTPQR